MPIYNFACDQCGKRFEELVAYERRQDVTCPDCQSKARVLLSGFAVKSAGGPAAASPAPSRSPFT